MLNEEENSPMQEQEPGSPNPEMKSILVEDYRSPEKKITGWLTFFLVAVLGLGTVVSLGMSIIDFSMDTYLEMIAPFSWMAITVDLLMMGGSTVLAVYAIYSFVNFRPNAVALGYMDLGLRLYNGVVLIVFGLLTGTEFTTAENPLRAIAGAGIWILYLYSSKQVSYLFPRNERIIYKRDKILLAAILIPNILYWTMLGSYLILN